MRSRFGPAEYLSFDHLDAVDVPFYWAAVVGQGQPCDDGVLVVSEAEGVQGGLIVDVDSSHPVLELVAAEAAHHGGEGADMSSRGKLWAGGQNGVELALVL